MKLPNRIIKESIWRSESLSGVSLHAQGFFLRLLPVPDDHGCFDARPAILRGLMYPLQLDKVRESNINKWLEELTAIDSIRLWVASDGISYGFFPSWSKHQRIRSTHKRKTPEPPDFVLFKKDEQKQEDISLADKRGQLSSSDGLNLNLNLNLKRKETKAKKDLFVFLWDQYPNKDGKTKAEQRFNASVNIGKEQDVADIKKALSNYISHLNLPANTWKHQKSGSTWFKNWRDWVDWVEPVKKERLIL